MDSIAELLIHPRTFRNRLGQYASGITVVSGIADGKLAGFTCQSFYSVSTEPPLVSFSVMLTSKTWPTIRPSGRFSVNVLSSHQHEISNAFARSGTDKWQGIDRIASRNGNPIITDSLMWLDCELFAEHEAGDHLIVIGKVIELNEDDWHDGKSPLLYFNGQYRHLGDLP